VRRFRLIRRRNSAERFDVVRLRFNVDDDTTEAAWKEAASWSWLKENSAEFRPIRMAQFVAIGAAAAAAPARHSSASAWLSLAWLSAGMMYSALRRFDGQSQSFRANAVAIGQAAANVDEVGLLQLLSAIPSIVENKLFAMSATGAVELSCCRAASLSAEREELSNRVGRWEWTSKRAAGTCEPICLLDDRCARNGSSTAPVARASRTIISQPMLGSCRRAEEPNFRHIRSSLSNRNRVRRKLWL